MDQKDIYVESPHFYSLRISDAWYPKSKLSGRWYESAKNFHPHQEHKPIPENLLIELTTAKLLGEIL